MSKTEKLWIFHIIPHYLDSGLGRDSLNRRVMEWCRGWREDLWHSIGPHSGQLDRGYDTVTIEDEAMALQFVLIFGGEVDPDYRLEGYYEYYLQETA